ncbi:threonine--tRNA ligase [Telmatocola sphagniphila]|uniref:Threonine--tRNA ligase n=1 Tax=Telmatocola sphagniphila TaxID=1123043 RepID=A0A8E6B1W4_9BACT|nr:threonine--tRNA ligase [Telmatocola sphagniphila]QVL29849.1 threonine--tRNA ligase [Telmatocola sphagniphila]
MLTLQLPDGSTRQVNPGTRPREIAEGIGKRLAQAAIAAKVNGAIVDLEREIEASDQPITFQLLTDKDRESLDVLRHSCAHVMARAVMRLFPGTQLAFGPTIENGFYYDIDSPTPITEADFPKIEAEMKAIVKQAEPFERFERSIPEGRGLVADLKQRLKVEHIDEELKKYPSISFYRQGEFIDLCRGPHIPHAGKIGAFKLLSIAGAYWKNDASRKQLQRLYGTAFFTQKELDAYLLQIEEAKKRDHRLLGKQLKLFTISQQAGQGLILWMPKGATVRHLLETFIREELVKRGYSPVYTPHIGNLNLYRTSGHFPYYADAQFPPIYFNPVVQTVDTWYTLLEKGKLLPEREESFLKLVEALSRGEFPEGADDYPRYTWSQISLDMRTLLLDYREAKDEEAKKHSLKNWMSGQEGYLLKPMNCPHHIQIYKAGPKSYRDLPIKLAEFGTVYRFEQSGELGGMTRVRGFTQDDAHLFVTPEQVEAELRSELELVLFILRTLNLTDYRVRVSVRDPASSKYVGAPELWDKAEKTLLDIVKSTDLNYVIGVGEAAFYGPKIDFIVRDCIGREWQLGTVQLDYNLPNRFDLEYIGADNQRHRPVMLHRAPFGSMERFTGILIEHFAGSFPLWLAPEQARIVTVSDKFIDYARGIETQLKAAGIRVTGDYRPEKIGSKIRDGSLEKIPYLLIIGEKEQNSNTVSLRDESIPDIKQRDIGALAVADLLSRFKSEIEEKRVRNVSTATAGLTDGAAKFGE